MSEVQIPCDHKYKRFRPWPIKLRWRCVRCHEVTRHFDSIDGMMGRPFHRHMSVAAKGWNTTK